MRSFSLIAYKISSLNNGINLKILDRRTYSNLEVCKIQHAKSIKKITPTQM